MIFVQRLDQGWEASLGKTTKKLSPKVPKLTHHELALLSERSKKFDPTATAEDCINDLRNLQNKFPLKSISRNFYRNHGKYSDATWNQHMGTFHEFRRQAGLELSRDQHSLERKVAKHASLDVYRTFYKEEVLPYHQKYTTKEDTGGRWKTVLVGSDFHDIDLDMFVNGVFVDTAARIQPDIITLNGDVFDNPEFSKYDQDPRDFKILERFNYVKKNIFGELRRACPNSQIDLVIGNHEFRILKLLAAKTPAMKVLLSDVMGLSLSDVFGLDEFEINLISKLDLAAFSNPDITSEVAENFKLYYGCFVAAHMKSMKFGVSGTSGHTHHPHQETFSNVPMGEMTWTNTGCMAITRAAYTEGMDDAQQSFMIAHIDTALKSVQQEHCIFAKDHIVVHGKRYTREK